MIDARRGTSTERGYDARWQRARTSYLAEHPLCVLCLAEGKVVAATTVDHIVPHRGDYRLLWSDSNWQALCTRHHSIKTATSDGAFGNVKRA
jgi:5-methylcytosine-specific restriction protein A